MRPRLRLYNGDEPLNTISQPDVRVRLGDIVTILADAVHSDRTWLRDFSEDEVQISPDLYEVLSAYWHLRPSA